MNLVEKYFFFYLETNISKLWILKYWKVKIINVRLDNHQGHLTLGNSPFRLVILMDFWRLQSKWVHKSTRKQNFYRKILSLFILSSQVSQVVSFQEEFIPRLVDELSRIFNDNSQVVLTPKQTVIVFKLFSFIAVVIEKSTLTSNLIKFLRSNHSEEFKLEKILIIFFSSNRLNKKKTV